MASPHIESLDYLKLLELGGIWFTAFVALVLPVLYRPRLRLLARHDGVGSSTYLAEPGPGEELWLKMGVANRTGLNAEEVQVRLILARQRGVQGRAAYRVFSSWWLKVSALPLTEISIPPKYIQYVDLCYLSVGPQRNNAKLYMAAVRPPVGQWDIEKAAIEAEPKLRLDAGAEYDILLAVAGRNTHASYWRVSLKWSVPELVAGEAIYGEDRLRAAVTLSNPRKVSRFLELEDLETLSKVLDG
jgi:hypothetical protein